MKYRLTAWFNSMNGNAAYGIEYQSAKGERYRHLNAVVAGVKRTLIYSEQQRCLEVIKGLRKQTSPDIESGLVPLKGGA